MDANRLIRSTKPQIVDVMLKEEVDVHGIPMTVMNVTEHSVRIRPHDVLVVVFKGIPMQIAKVVDGDLVLRPIPPGVSMNRIKPTVGDTN